MCHQADLSQGGRAPKIRGSHQNAVQGQVLLQEVVAHPGAQLLQLWAVAHWQPLPTLSRLVSPSA